MDDLHQAWLLLGSNMEPEAHLRRAIELLRGHGRIPLVSRAWESSAVGGQGPNFLNACVLLLTPLGAEDGAEDVTGAVIRPIEAALGRVRSANRYAPRPIDIDLLLYDQEAFRPDYWEQAFAMVPLAELAPGFTHPLTHEPLAEAAQRLRGRLWIVARPEVLDGLQSVPEAGLDP
jgi:2-amino-4-hydroxy-6-hydroxymethyldihydropteridine diphosphokinase